MKARVTTELGDALDSWSDEAIDGLKGQTGDLRMFGGRVGTWVVLDVQRPETVGPVKVTLELDLETEE